MNKLLWGITSLMAMAGMAYAQGGVAAAAASRPTARAASDTELGRRYVDAMRGYSLCPPVDVDRRRDAAGTVTTTWSRRDANSSAILWSISAQTARNESNFVDIQTYSQALAKRIAYSNFEILSNEIGKVAGADAIHFCGVTQGKLYQHQTWILPHPKQFLILTITGPQDIKPQLESIFSAVLASVQLIDPEKAREETSQNVERGNSVLDSLQNRHFHAAVSPEPRWFLLQMKSKSGNYEDVGFLVQTEGASRRDGAEGFEVQNWLSLKLPGDKPRILRRWMFATPDRNFEHWDEVLKIGIDKDAVIMREEGIKQAQVLLCTVWDENGPQAKRRKVTELMQKFYLPKMTGAMLPCMLDLTRPAAYTFAAYNSQTNDFDLRTITVGKPETITVNRMQTEATTATDQSSADVEAANLWLDSKGRLLRMTTSDGLLMELSTKEVVLQRNPGADIILPEIGKQMNFDPPPRRIRTPGAIVPSGKTAP